MKFKGTFSILIIHLALPGRNIDNIYHVVQILVKQSLVTERTLSLCRWRLTFKRLEQPKKFSLFGRRKKGEAKEG